VAGVWRVEYHNRRPVGGGGGGIGCCTALELQVHSPAISQVSSVCPDNGDSSATGSRLGDAEGVAIDFSAEPVLACDHAWADVAISDGVGGGCRPSANGNGEALCRTVIHCPAPNSTGDGASSTHCCHIYKFPGGAAIGSARPSLPDGTT
jgi:hypothetical protein